jgi:hypothetical protein
LGVILYEMLAGKVPFNDESAMSVALKHISDPPPSPRLHNADITPQMELMVLRALEKEPERRYANGEAMIRALESVLGIVDEGEMTREVVMPDISNLSRKKHVPSKEPPDQDTNSTVIPPKTMPEPVPSKRSTPWKMIAAGGGLAVLAIILAVLAMSGGSGAGNTAVNDITPTAVGATVALGDETEQGTEEAPATSTERPATATRKPTMTATDEPTEVAAAPDVETDVAIKLIYNKDSLVLLNQSDGAIDISGLTFVQVMDDGPNLTFSTRRWNGGSAPLAALPAGDCFQVWTTEITEQPVPETCNARHKWDQASFPRWFWISDSANTEFEVRLSGEVIAHCRIGDGECLVDLA